MAIIRDLHESRGEFPNDCVIGKCLEYLGERHHPELPAFAQRYQHDANERIWRSALRALACYMGINPREHAGELVRRREWDELPGAVRTFVLADQLDGEVRNGGFLQYFSNPSGEYYKEALEALREVGAVHSLDILSRAVERFGASGPSRDRDARNDQLAKLMDGANDRPFDDLDEQWYEDPDRLEAKLMTFAMLHARAFGAAI
jgi:hypothetical protein